MSKRVNFSCHCACCGKADLSLANFMTHICRECRKARRKKICFCKMCGKASASLYCNRLCYQRCYNFINSDFVKMAHQQITNHSIERATDMQERYEILQHNKRIKAEDKQRLKLFEKQYNMDADLLTFVNGQIGHITLSSPPVVYKQGTPEFEAIAKQYQK